MHIGLSILTNGFQVWGWYKAGSPELREAQHGRQQGGTATSPRWRLYINIYMHNIHTEHLHMCIYMYICVYTHVNNMCVSICIYIYLYCRTVFLGLKNFTNIDGAIVLI